MKKGLFLVTMSFAESHNTNYGVWKKTEGEYRAFKKKYDVKLVEAYFKTSKLKKAMARIPFFPNAFDPSRIKDDISKIDFIYLRYDYGDFPTVLFMKKVKKLNPQCKIIIEIPTYRVNMDVLASKWHQKIYILKHKVWTKRLYKYVDRAVVFHEMDKAYGIPTICTINGIDVDREKVKKFTVYAENAPINLISVSNMISWHGLDRAITGLHEYMTNERNLRDIRIHFVGSGREEEKLREMTREFGLQDHVTFYGYQYGEALDAIYDECDIGIEVLGMHRNGLPENETFSSTLKSREYFAKGIPMLSEAVFDGHYDSVRGYIFKVPFDESPLNYNEIVKFYDYCYKGKKEGELENKLRKFANETFGFDHVLKDVFDYIDGK